DAGNTPEALVAEERIRQTQQGLGRPIVAFRTAEDYQMVAVGNTLYWSKTWQAFPDFLTDYFRQKLGTEWVKAEIAKPLAARHPLMQWFEAIRGQMKGRTPGKVRSAVVTGAVACFLGVAYGLYLLDHNAELQSRLINRLKNPGNFQGAYYELIVASTLIRAGF